MNILYVAAEVAPFVKTGGLADVAAALPDALGRLGHDVRIVMPRYRQLRERGTPMHGPITATFLPIGERQEELRVWRATATETPTYLLDIPAAFERDAIYGERDDDRRFILFSRGVLALMQHLREVEQWQPEVLHANDWHASLLANYLRTYYRYTFGHIGTLLSVHNLAYQGQFSTTTLGLAGLSDGGLLEATMGPSIAGSFNFMARGILFNDVISTVSPTYAQEILTPEYGERLDPLLRSRQHRIAGVLNGIDTERYDPRRDQHIAAPYDADDTSGKAQCKAALQQELGLDVAPHRPLLGIVSRLVEQKGVDLLSHIVPWLVGHTNAQLVALGAGSDALKLAFRHHAMANPTRIAARFGFDEALAQRVYAGSDAFLMPSRFEPCGLGQMIALRYGSVPIVRATGGLNDTVREGFEGNGFRFHPFEAGHFIGAIERALAAYRQPDSWALLRDRGMREDHGWAQSASKYLGLYQWAMQLAGRS